MKLLELAHLNGMSLDDFKRETVTNMAIIGSIELDEHCDFNATATWTVHCNDKTIMVSVSCQNKQLDKKDEDQ